MFDIVCRLLHRSQLVRAIVSTLATSIVRFGNDSLFRKGEIRLFESSPLLGRVVLSSASAIHIVVSLEPLYELQVVLVLGPSNLLDLNNSNGYVDVLLNSEFVKSGLQNLKIANELIVEFGLPVKLVHGDLVWMDNIQNLTIDVACPQSLDLGNLDLSRVEITCRRLFSHSKISDLGTKYASSMIPNA